MTSKAQRRAGEHELTTLRRKLRLAMQEQRKIAARIARYDARQKDLLIAIWLADTEYKRKAPDTLNDDDARRLLADLHTAGLQTLAQMRRNHESN